MQYAKYEVSWEQCPHCGLYAFTVIRKTFFGDKCVSYAVICLGCAYGDFYNYAQSFHTPIKPGGKLADTLLGYTLG